MSRTRLLLLACAMQPVVIALAAAPVVVDQVNRAFAIRDLSIKHGDVVRFHNADEFTHHIYVQSPTFSFKSGEQERGTDVDVKFPVAGQFEVRCEIHPRMRLNVTAE